MRTQLLATAACFAVLTGALGADERATLSGRIVDALGHPADHATVLVYEARVKKGYGLFCPTCWVDCGKHAASDGQGNFTIGGLSPDLKFTLLVVSEGFAATYVRDVDPASGRLKDIALVPRKAIEDPSQIVRGNVVNRFGDPVADAVVEQQGVSYKGMTSFGPSGWVDQMAVTNKNGEFEIAYGQPAVRMILEVTARGMAPKLFTEETGADRKTMTVTEGAVIRGRLMSGGKPVGNAEVGLFSHNRASGKTFAEMRVGTREDGTFIITNVPAGRIWEVYPKMESLAARGIGGSPVFAETKDDGQEVNVGDVALVPAHKLRGRVRLADGNTMPADMHVTLAAENSWDSQIVNLHSGGEFEFSGVPLGVYSVSPAVKGYRLEDGWSIEVLVQNDIADLSIHMQPEIRAK